MAEQVSRHAASVVSRRAAFGVLCLPALLASCGGPRPPGRYEPLSWDYLPTLRLNVAEIAMDEGWSPRPGVRDLGHLAPTPPAAALRRMAEDRLVAAGTSGRAEFVVEDASLVAQRGSYVGNFLVRLDVATSDGTRSGYAEARVARTRTIDDDSPEGTRAELYDLVRQMMTDMNVEFEYQVRHSLRDYLQTGVPEAPAPGPVEQQELAPPPGAPEQLAPSPEQLAPPPGAPGDEPPPPPAPPRVPSAVPFSSPAPTPPVR